MSPRIRFFAVIGVSVFVIAGFGWYNYGILSEINDAEVGINGLDKELRGQDQVRQNIVDAQRLSMMRALTKKKIPYRTFYFLKKGEKELGTVFTFFVLETLLLSRLMNVNPFDQPAVEQVKIETKKILR